MEEIAHKLTSRHIAKLLTRLGDTIAPTTQHEIKQEFRWLEEDFNTAVKEYLKELLDAERVHKSISQVD